MAGYFFGSSIEIHCSFCKFFIKYFGNFMHTKATICVFLTAGIFNTDHHVLFVY